jgi:hypothetical protein
MRLICNAVMHEVPFLLTAHFIASYLRTVTCNNAYVAFPLIALYERITCSWLNNSKLNLCSGERAVRCEAFHKGKGMTIW